MNPHCKTKLSIYTPILMAKNGLSFTIIKQINEDLGHVATYTPDMYHFNLI